MNSSFQKMDSERKAVVPSWRIDMQPYRYRSSVETDVQATWRRFGWRPGKNPRLDLKTPFDEVQP